MGLSKPLEMRGFQIFKGLLEKEEQTSLVGLLRQIVTDAPMVSPVTQSGKAMSVRMTSAGDVGWVTDRAGYRYQEQHPNGSLWPKIPVQILDIWRLVSRCDQAPNSCLINYYGENAKMGMHQDKDEGRFDWPVVSVSLGDDALFRMGNPERGGKTESLWLSSGDVVVMGGAARLSYHGVDRIRFGSASLLPKGGRLNITLRVVDF